MIKKFTRGIARKSQTNTENEATSCIKKEEATKFPFNLAPTDQAKIDVYENVLNYALDNNDIKNIAITGPLWRW